MMQDDKTEGRKRERNPKITGAGKRREKKRKRKLRRKK